MKGYIVAGFGAWLCCSAYAFAGQFEPKLAAVCSPDPQSIHSMKLSKPKLIGRLLQNEGISITDLDPNGDAVSYERQVAAILAGEEYCGSHEEKCTKDTANALGMAATDLLNFIFQHSKPIDPKKSGIYIMRIDNTETVDPVDDFLSFDKIYYEATCIVASEATASAGTSTSAAGPTASTGADFLLRSKIEDLTITQADKEAFKKIDRATISINDDFAKDTHAFNVQAVSGYGTGRRPMLGAATDPSDPEDAYYNDYYQGALFVTYTRQFVGGSGAKKNRKDVENIGFGLTGDVLFLAGIHHDLQFVPYFIHSLKSDADIFSANLIYTPMPDWPGIGTVYVVGGLVGVQIKPQLKLVYGDVLDDGNDSDLSSTNDFGRIGPRIEFSARAWDDTWLDGLSFLLSYDYLRVFRGQQDFISRLEASLNYSIPKQEYVGVQFKYIDGRNLDTLERQQLFTVGLGLKY